MSNAIANLEGALGVTLFKTDEPDAKKPLIYKGFFNSGETGV
jgi:hypothetical protein